MKIGFIGSNEGMTEGQRETLRQILAGHGPGEFHHSYQLGADADAHTIAREACPASRVIVHPPRDESLRAYLQADAQRHARGRIARNREIVGECDILIAAPGTGEGEHSSEVWSMIRYSWRHNVRVVVLNPE